MRYSAIGAALILGVVYSLANAQGIAEVDTVERFHFVEYGLITLLFYRAWRPVGDASLFVLPVLAGLLVGTAEEWLQWFIPGRIGDMRDVFLNGASIVCGLLFSLGLDPPDKLSLAFDRGSLRRIGIVACSVALVFAAFVFTVHVGVENHDAGAGTFRSRYDMTTLVRLSQDRAVRWKEDPPVARPASLSREDQYQNEGHLHVRERNRLWDAGDIRGAWQENLILEKFFAPVLDAPSFLSKSGHRWPDAQRSDAEQRVSAAPRAPAIRRGAALVSGPCRLREPRGCGRGTPLHPALAAGHVLECRADADRRACGRDVRVRPSPLTRVPDDINRAPAPRAAAHAARTLSPAPRARPHTSSPTPARRSDLPPATWKCGRLRTRDHRRS